MKEATAQVISSVWLRIEERAEQLGHSAHDAWLMAEVREEQEERKHRRIGAQYQQTPIVNFSSKTAARYFCVKWFIEAYSKKISAISCDDIIHMRPGRTLAQAVAGYYTARYGDLAVPLASDNEITTIESIDYAVEMNSKIARTRAA